MFILFIHNQLKKDFISFIYCDVNLFREFKLLIKRFDKYAKLKNIS